MQQTTSRNCESLVNDVRLTPISLKMSIQDWVNKTLIPCHLTSGILEQPPQPFNRSYFPTNKDLRNMAHRAIVKTLFGQEAVEMLLKEQAGTCELRYFFQKYSSKDLKQEHEGALERYIVIARYKNVSSAELEDSS